MHLPTGILAHCYRTDNAISAIAKRRRNQRRGGRVKAGCAIVAYAFCDLLAKLNAKLVKWVNAQQYCVYERPVFVKGN